jgi:FkbM family methyltransferase
VSKSRTLKPMAIDDHTLESDPLVGLLHPERLTEVVDIGALPVDGHSPPYQPLLEKRLCRLIGFEPQEDALATLSFRKSDLETYLPYVVGDGKQGLLRACWGKSMTSLLASDPATVRHFHNFEDWCRVEQELPVLTHRLDDISEIETIDFLKIDAQGAELLVFQNGRQRLKHAVAIQSEVSFLRVYENQPCFGEIDLELRTLGFVPHTFASFNKQPILPFSFDNLHYDDVHQVLEADIVYVRDFTRPAAMHVEQLKHLAIIAHYCYRSFDLAMHCIRCLAARGALAPEATHSYAMILKPGHLQRET